MRAHVIEDGKIVNTIMVESLDQFPGMQLVDAELGGDIGDSYDTETGAIPAAPPTPTMPELAGPIPMLNLHLVLIEDGHLETVEVVIQSMPGPEGQRARAYWNKALTARRDNEWVNLLWPQLYANEAEFDDAWARGAALDP